MEWGSDSEQTRAFFSWAVILIEGNSEVNNVIVAHLSLNHEWSEGVNVFWQRSLFSAHYFYCLCILQFTTLTMNRPYLYMYIASALFLVVFNFSWSKINVHVTIYKPYNAVILTHSLMGLLVLLNWFIAIVLIIIKHELYAFHWKLFNDLDAYMKVMNSYSPWSQGWVSEVHIVWSSSRNLCSNKHLICMYISFQETTV